jgi:putative acyl-CoA dehydrogenase
MTQFSEFDTHRVENQPPEFAPRNLWADDLALRQAVAREGGGWAADAMSAYGALCGDELYRIGFDANRERPRLVTHDPQGRRVDRVDFHPAYHRLMGCGVEHGVSNFSWRSERDGAVVARSAMTFLHHQAEAGTNCPLTMTHAAVPVLRGDPALSEWADKAVAPVYDPRDVAIEHKRGVTLGMGMTEKQGGSDVRSNTTRADPLPASGEYRLVGHKWFLSAPMSDAWLVLAQAPGGLSCFLMPRRLPDGRLNGLRLMRLKDKVGNWSNASSEVEFCGAWARRVGEEGRGVATIIEMVAHTRLDCMIGAAAQMRMGLSQALHHARHRHSFGKPLVEHALMRNVLGDLALESEAATALSMRVARAVGASARDPREAAFARIATAVGKYWLCRRAPAFVNEAQECLGGAGYVEESYMARLYREAPLNAIWEGCSNIQCLDVLRALRRQPECVDAVLAELEAGAGVDESLDEEVAVFRGILSGSADLESGARFVVERLALALQASILLRTGEAAVASAFCRSRLDDRHGLAFGTLSADTDFPAILARAQG